MKLIFLDIDGVLNSNDFYHRRHKTIKEKIIRRLNRVISWYRKLRHGDEWYKHESYQRRESYEYQFKRLVTETDPEKWKWLSEFCNNNDYKICISSTWRNHFGNKEGNAIEWWKQAFLDLGFNEGIFVGITGSRKSCRGEEIKQFINVYNHKYEDKIEDYAILDDDSDMLEDQFKKFHYCDAYYGLSPNNLYRIDRQFRKLNSYEYLTYMLDKNKF